MKIIVDYETYHAICIAAARVQGSLEKLMCVLDESLHTAEAVAQINCDLEDLADALAPLTLADCQWTSNHPQAQIRRRDYINSVMLAVVMGAIGAMLVLLVRWLLA